MRILHLSDLHLGTPKFADHQNLVIGRLLECVEEERNSYGALDFILITGDLVWGNDSKSPISYDDQWGAALDFIADLQKAAGGVTPANTLIVPGNHDVDRHAVSGVTRTSLRSTDADGIDGFLLEPQSRADILKGLGRFGAMLDLGGLPGAAAFQENGYTTSLTECDGLRIGFAMANTSLAAFDDNDRNNLWFGRPQMDHLIGGVQDADIKVLLTHHPVSWLRDIDERRFEDRISDEFDIHLYGHEHHLSINDSSAILRLGTGASYDHEGTVENYFSVLTLEPTDRSGQLRVWELTAASGHQWRPCTRVRYDSRGFVNDLNVDHVFGAQPVTQQSAADETAPLSLHPDESIRDLVSRLEERYRFRWQTGDYTEAGFTPTVFWPIRLREPTVIHAVQAFVAAALSGLGAAVHLVVDDLGDPDTNNRNSFEGQIRSWMNHVRPDAAESLEISYLLEILDTPEAAAPGWSVVRNWWSVPKETLVNVFRVSKLVADGEDFAEAEVRSPRRLMSPPMVWAGLAITTPVGGAEAVITLCGDDERLLWETWQRYCDTSRGLPTGHLFIPPLADAEGAPLHMAQDSLCWRDRVAVERFLSEARAKGNFDALRWLSRYCVDLPLELRGDVPQLLVTDETHLSDPQRMSALESALAALVGA